MAVLPVDSSPLFFQKLRELIAQLDKEGFAQPFHEPVDWKAMGLPDYPKVVLYPMDLSTMLKKLDTKQYSSIQEVFYDMFAIRKACITYNGEKAAITNMVGQLYQRFQAGVDDIFEQYYKANAETVNRVKQKVSDVLSTMDPSSLFPLFSWLNTVCVEGITKNDETITFDLNSLKARDFDKLVRYLNLSW
ncbi:hypothetical protein WA556_003732 [Blastocystis sp. ATCC 50177/Nand II]